MKKILYIIITSLFALNAKSQTIDSAVNPMSTSVIYDSIYGFNPLLINGINNFNTYLQTEGHQYFNSKEFSSGSITIKNHQFQNCLLNYDVYNQQVYLEYTDKHGATNMLKLSNAWIDEFTLQKDTFRLESFKNYDRSIFQVIGKKNVQILFAWKKEYKLNSTQSTSTYLFTEPTKVSYIKINDNIVRFKNNRSFIKSFNSSVQSNIKQYLKTNKISISSASTETLVSLVNYCNNIIAP